MGHTAVSATQASSVTGNMEPKRITVKLKLRIIMVINTKTLIIQTGQNISNVG